VAVGTLLDFGVDTALFDVPDLFAQGGFEVISPEVVVILGLDHGGVDEFWPTPFPELLLFFIQGGLLDNEVVEFTFSVGGTLLFACPNEGFNVVEFEFVFYSDEAFLLHGGVTIAELPLGLAQGGGLVLVFAVPEVCYFFAQGTEGGVLVLLPLSHGA
jgi:hypothetical protein